MDLSTIGGIAATSILILVGILLGSSIVIFIDPVSIIIVCGGTVACTFIGFQTGTVKSAMSAFTKVAIKTQEMDSSATIELLQKLSTHARREGLLALEGEAEQAEDEFLKRGLRLMIDGHEASTIETMLFDELGKMEERHKQVIDVWDGIGAYSPAMGLIGTLVGLVQMLQQMDDPAAIGPAMAVALLTTFYGALISNILGIPVANKLRAKSVAELAYKELIAQGMLSILAGENPRFMVERLRATLPPSQRGEEAA